MSLIMRAATPNDAPAITKLILLAYKEFAYLICATSQPALVLERLEYYFRHPSPTLIHYSHYSVLVEEQDGTIVGTTGYLRGDFIPTFYSNLAQILSQFNQNNSEIFNSIRTVLKMREAFEGEFYLDILAVDENQRGKGYANLLLAEAERWACFSGLPYMVLLAPNHLLDFYYSKDFCFYQHRTVGGFIYNCLRKKLQPSVSKD